MGCERPADRSCLDAADDTEFRLLPDSNVGQTKEANVKFIQKMLANSPARIQKSLADLFAVLVPLDAFVMINEVCISSSGTSAKRL